MASKGNTIKSLSNFVEILTKKHFLSRKIEWVFRGVSNKDYKLIPKIGRRINSENNIALLKTEQSMFDIFKRQAHPHLTYTPRNDYEWLTLAQHHGLPTRLLDWSLNPLVALYFAVERGKENDGALYALKADKKLPNHIIKKDKPFEIKINGGGELNVCKYLPTLVTKRIVAQEGLFTIHSNSKLTTHLGDCLRDGWEIEQFIIPHSIKEDIKHTLYRLGFHRSFLFQDLDSLANHIEWHHLLDREKKQE
jgi:type I restriction enzyme M protein